MLLSSFIHNLTSRLPSPWLPQFPKSLERTISDPILDPGTRSTRFPKQKFFLDTIYPRLPRNDSRLRDIEFALGPLFYRQPQEPAPTTPTTLTPLLRPPLSEEPAFVEINGILTKKRRANDPEVDLVAAIQDCQDTTPPSFVTISRTSFNPNSELEYLEKVEQHMFEKQALTARISGIMSALFAPFPTIRDTFRRYLCSQSYAVSESRSFVLIPETKTFHVATKRRKIVTEQFEFEWLDRNGLDLLISRFEHLRECFRRVNIVVLRPESRPKMNKILRPLLQVLADDDDDIYKLQSTEDGHDLCTLFCLLCDNMFRFLGTIYEISSFIKAKDKFPRVPRIYEYNLDPEARQTVIRTKNFMSAPNLLTVLRDILEVGGLLDDGYPAPVDIISYIILDMTAVENGIILPSYVMHNDFHQKMFKEILPNGLGREEGYEKLPGTFTDVDIDLIKEPEGKTSNNINNIDVVKVKTPTRPSSPPAQIAKAEKGKTGQLRAKFLERKMLALGSDGFRSKYYVQNEAHEAIKKTYISEFDPKDLKKGQEATTKSILKNRCGKTPKRLAMKLAPKTVRFTENTISPHQRMHIGFDVPRLSHDEEGEPKPLMIGQLKLKPREAPEPSPPADADETEYSALEQENRNGDSIFPGAKWIKSSKDHKKNVDPTVAIEKILSLPSIGSLMISDETKAGIAVRKEKAAREAAEEARKLAEERSRKEREERLAKSGGLRVPEQPLVSPLSSDWLARVHATVHAGSTTTLATTAEGVDLRRHDFAKVVPPTTWVNDEIVNGCLNWLDQSINMAAGIKDVKKKTRKCLAMSSFFFKRLREQGVTQTQRTLRRYGVEKRNLLDVDTILLPICELSHWTLLVIRPSKKTIAHMDSLNQGGSQQYIDIGLAWLKNLLEEKFLDAEWKVMQHEAPRQTNGYDCGVHTITNGICIALGLSPIDSYTSGDMPQQRLNLACMLLNGGFKGEFDLRVY